MTSNPLVWSAVLLMSSCLQNPGPEIPTYSTRTVEASDFSGVASVSCPSTHRVVGGGCHCEGVSDVLFGSQPAGNGFVCGCYDYGSAGGAATAGVICLASSVPTSLKQGLEAADPELEAAVDRFRAQRDQAPSRP